MTQLALSPELIAAVQQRISSGAYSSAEELLLDALGALDRENDSVRELQEAQDAFDAGEHGVPLDEAFARVRRKLGIPTS